MVMAKLEWKVRLQETSQHLCFQMHVFRAAFKLWHAEYIQVLWPGTLCHNFCTSKYSFIFIAFSPLGLCCSNSIFRPNVEPVLPISNNSFGVNSAVCLIYRLKVPDF